MIFEKLIKSITAQKQLDRRSELYQNLIRHEAKIGGKLFGPVPQGGRREFFCLDEYTWVWHEEWTDTNGRQQSKTTRYEFRSDNVLKSQNGQYQPVNEQELRHLRSAIEKYGEQVYKELYSKIPQ